MPHLDASALESDPEGMAVLKGVLGRRHHAAAAPSWSANPKAPALPPLSPHHRLAAASFRAGLRLFVFALLLASIARSRASRI